VPTPPPHVQLTGFLFCRFTGANKVNTPTNTHYFHLYQCHWQNGYLLWCIIPLIVSNSQLKTNHHNILVWWPPCLCAPVDRTCRYMRFVLFRLGSAMFGNRTNRGANPARTPPMLPIWYGHLYSTDFYDSSIKQYLNLMRKKIMQVATTKYWQDCIYL
jgi:hypothetical protein